MRRPGLCLHTANGAACPSRCRRHTAGSHTEAQRLIFSTAESADAPHAFTHIAANKSGHGPKHDPTHRRQRRQASRLPACRTAVSACRTGFCPPAAIVAATASGAKTPMRHRPDDDAPRRAQAAHSAESAYLLILHREDLAQRQKNHIFAANSGEWLSRTWKVY